MRAQTSVLAGVAMPTLSCSNSKQSFEELHKVTQIMLEMRVNSIQALSDAI